MSDVSVKLLNTNSEEIHQVTEEEGQSLRGLPVAIELQRQQPADGIESTHREAIKHRSDFTNEW